jgi:hypothetical protein
MACTPGRLAGKSGGKTCHASPVLIIPQTNGKEKSRIRKKSKKNAKKTKKSIFRTLTNVRLLKL